MNYPLKDIPAPHPHDVLCGRGGATNNHIGNSHWRMLVAANKQLYITLPKRQKMLLSRSIVNAVRSQNPPGRFLQKESKASQWFDVGDQRAQEKTSQALREGAPDIRKKGDGSGLPVDSDDVQSTEKPTIDPGDHSTSDKNGTRKKIPPVKKSDKDQQQQQQQPPTPVPTPTPSSVPAAPPVAPVAAAASAPAHNMSAPQQHTHPYGVMGQMPMAALDGGGMGQYMPQAMASAGGHHNMMYYGHPNMQQMVSTMVMNSQGIMVPGMALLPVVGTGGPPIMPPPQQQISGAGSSMTQPCSNVNQVKADEFEPTPIFPNGNAKTPTFDEFVAAAAPDGLDGGVGMSFGSVGMMHDADTNTLQAAGTSFGSVMSYKYMNNTQHGQAHWQQGNDGAVPQALSGLEPADISFGDASMMSAGNGKLELGGTSFGTMMSHTTMPDGGLEAVGTSFGSLSLDAANRNQLFEQLELAGGGPEIPPMFNSEDKATGNLLECSDTESEGSASKPELASQKSAAWERMQASVAQNKMVQSQSRGTLGSSELMPPPAGGRMGGNPGESYIVADMNGTVLSVPTTNFQRDFSQLSAFGDDNAYAGESGGLHGDDDDDAAPPPQLSKQGIDEEEAFVGYISRAQV